MASKADLSALAIISAIAGAVRLLHREKRLAQTLVLQRIQRDEDFILDIRDQWFSVTDAEVKKVVGYLKEWGEGLDQLNIPGQIKTLVMIKIALFAATDLNQMLRDKQKTEWTDAIIHKLKKLDEIFDPNGEAFLSAREADMILNPLYEKIGFKL